MKTAGKLEEREAGKNGRRSFNRVGEEGGGEMGLVDERKCDTQTLSTVTAFYYAKEGEEMACCEVILQQNAWLVFHFWRNADGKLI